MDSKPMNNIIPRFDRSQIGRTLVLPKLSQQTNPASGDEGRNSSNDDENDDGQRTLATAPNAHRFVICADTQYGMITDNEEWEMELEYSRNAIQFMNGMNPRPIFCCVCGDLTDMDRSFEVNKTNSKFTLDECDEIQLRQRRDFKAIWSKLHDDIALVCLCGNHDVGNRPSKQSMELYKKEFGDDYLAFWSSPNVYNIFLNTTLFSDPSGDETTEEMSRNQFRWLEEQLRNVRSEQPLKNNTQQQQQQIIQRRSNNDNGNDNNGEATIFVFGHHPWFLYDENEEADTMTGSCEWKSKIIPDSYFVIPKETRGLVMELFRKYNVAASFAGHFHQNLVSETSFGMKMIITGPLSAMLESSGKKGRKAEIDDKTTADSDSDFDSNNNNILIDEPDTQGLRLVEVSEDGSFRHEFISII
jgi:hypothetical protein